MANKSICKIEGCGKRVYGHGWCAMHYQRWKAHGDPLAGRTPNGEALRYIRDVVLKYEGDECLIWPFFRGEDGRGTMRHNGRTRKVHRVVCEEVNGSPPTPEHDAAHSCGKGHEGCITKGHLSWKTKAENAADRLVHDTHNRGERHTLAKLTRAEVEEILSLKGRLLQREIAAQFGICQQLVSSIHRGKKWTWLE